ncbi:MAG: hypothetical protein L6R41_001946 [Letrouitia leprolyta]|nr:MAG: hypothetical protein L6R41_001946 [Letrouitia leprolyta]
MARSHRLDNPALFLVADRTIPPASAISKRNSALLSMSILKCAILKIPIYATTQNAARLGPICSELSLPPSAFQSDKTAFSMLIPSLNSALKAASSSKYQVAIVGIETHICVTQTALDLLAEGHTVYVLADGVSSCNQGEIAIALRRLVAEGAVVTTSEGWLYECMGDASIPDFKAIAALVKETKDNTRDAVQALCKM